jgi:hypothetical protein
MDLTNAAPAPSTTRDTAQQQVEYICGGKTAEIKGHKAGREREEREERGVLCLCLCVCVCEREEERERMREGERECVCVV